MLEARKLDTTHDNGKTISWKLLDACSFPLFYIHRTSNLQAIFVWGLRVLERTFHFDKRNLTLLPAYHARKIYLGLERIRIYSPIRHKSQTICNDTVGLYRGFYGASWGASRRPGDGPQGPLRGPWWFFGGVLGGLLRGPVRGQRRTRPWMDASVRGVEPVHGLPIQASTLYFTQ